MSMVTLKNSLLKNGKRKKIPEIKNELWIVLYFSTK